MIAIFLIFLLSVSASTKSPQKNEEENIFVQAYFSLLDSGEKSLNQGNFRSAIEAYKQALLWAREELSVQEEIRCYMRLGLLHWNIGQMSKSSEYYKKACSLSIRFKQVEEIEECQTYLEIYCAYTEGKKYRSQKQYEESIGSFNDAIRLARKIESKAHELKCLRQQSVTYWKLYDFQRFLELNEAALSLAKAINHVKEEGRCLNNIGVCHEMNTNYSKALIFYFKALKIARDLESKFEESILLNNIGLIYKNVGNYKKAIDFFEESLSIDEKLDIQSNISKDLNNIGTLYRQKSLIFGGENNFHIALNYYKRGLEIAKRLANIQTEIQLINNIGTVLIDMGNYEEAMKYFQSGFCKAELVHDMEAMGMIMANVGITHFHVGNFDRALEYLEKSIKIGKDLQANQILWEAFFWQGRCYEKKMEFQRAINAYEKAINIIENLRSQITLDTDKTGFARDKLKVYGFLLELLHRLHSDQPQLGFEKELFHIVERAKARSYLESLKESKIDITEKLTPELSKQEKAISREISTITAHLSQSNHPSGKRGELIKELKQKEDEYFELISRIRFSIPEIADIVSPKPRSVESIRDAIVDNETAIVEYFLGENRSFMFLVTKDDLKFYSLPSKITIENSLKAYIKVLSQIPKGRSFKGSLASKRICQELMLSDEKIPDQIQNLIIIPDGILYYLPFETLIDSSQKGTSGDVYLIEKYRISYSPSASSLMFLLENEGEETISEGFFAFANPFYERENKSNNQKNYVNFLNELYNEQGFDITPLPFSQKEVHRVSKYFPEEKRNLFFDKEAKEETLKSTSLRDYRVIHFACHGLLDREFPFRSALVLALDGETREDGFLQVREIYNLRMQAELVVLSACQTGKGKLEKWEGVFGLPRIFFYAGARSVLSTLWRVEDRSTAKFMEYFYYHLAQGEGKAEALQSAKLEMISSKLSHPFYWGTFILNGDYTSTIDFE